jgi:hypothetical protein
VIELAVHRSLVGQKTDPLLLKPGGKAIEQHLATESDPSNDSTPLSNRESPKPHWSKKPPTAH